MTVSELIKMLKEYEGDTPVHIGYDYGDYPNTLVAPQVVDVEEVEIVDSAYHQMPKVWDADPDANDQGVEPREAVLILSRWL